LRMRARSAADSFGTTTVSSVCDLLMLQCGQTDSAVYLDLLEDPYWRVSALDAILAW
jgi:hypothetical protein